MRLKQSTYYFQNGVKTLAQLTRPRMIPIKKLHLPLSSVYQFFADSQAILGPSPQDLLFNTEGGRVFIEHVTRLEGSLGNPRRTVLQPFTMENEFRRKNRLFKPLRKDEALTINNKNLLVVNYNMLNPLYRYVASYKATYYRWYNNQTTFWDHVLNVHNRFGWDQYIELELPETVLTLANYRQFEKAISQETLKKFSTVAHLNLFDVYRWLGKDRQQSLLARLPQEALKKINLLIKARTHFLVINLGVLDAMRRNPDDTESRGEMPATMQYRFLRLVHGLHDFVAGAIHLEDTDGEGNGDLVIPTPVEEAVKEAAVPKVTTTRVTDSASGDDDEDGAADDVEEPHGEESEAEQAEASSDLLPSFDLSSLSLPPMVEIDSRAVADDDDDLVDESYQADVVPDITEEDVEPTTTDTRDDPLAQGIAARAWELSELGIITPRAYNRAVEDALTYHNLPDPFGSGKTIAEAMQYAPDDLELPPASNFPDKATIVDKSMLSSKLKNLQRKYNQVVMTKDVLQCVMAVQNQGVAVKDYQIETVRDSMNHFVKHSITLKPLRGRQSTIHFRYPVIDKDGRFISNGTKYRMKLQRADLPIRKVNPARVALTSYYNKTFVDRSQRAKDDYDRWLIREIKTRGQDAKDESILDLRLGNVFDHETQLPRIYTLLAREFIGFRSGGYEFFFDWHRREEFFKARGIDIQQVENAGQVVVAALNDRAVLLDTNNVLYLNTPDGDEAIGNITDVLGIDPLKAPLEIAEMTVQNKLLTVGFVLSYYYGLSDLIKQLGAEMSRHQRGERLNVGADDYTLVFQDEVLVFSRLDARSTMILAGLRRYHHTLKHYSVWDFDKKDVYYRILEDAGLGVRMVRELEALKAAWVDPITKGLLVEMGEPTQFDKLLVRAVELLMTDYSPKEVDPAFMRYRGYERFAGAIYGELARAVKTFNNRAGSGEHAVELNPHQIWQKIVGDGANGQIEEANPIANLREQEAITYRGDGGRSSTSMVERTRIYHDNDVGTVSESTVDSGDVGVIAYLSPDANIINLRGVTRKYDKEQDGPAKLLSSSALLSPCADKDDPKRINFIAIQQQQGIFADGYDVTPLRTGYEQVVAQRTTSIFASSAPMDGVVTKVGKFGMTVKYLDGTEESFPLGLRHGNATGVTYPHDLVTDLKEGDSFTVGDTISYNRKYFKPDRMTPGQVAWKAGVLATVAFIDNIDTLEDGCAISVDLAKKFTTQTTEVKTIVVRFDQLVHELIKVGDHVDLDSILCTIEDPETARNTLFDDASMDTLRRVSAMTPRAHVVGTVSRIECFYHGDFEDLNENLQVYARASDKERKRQAREAGEAAFDGQVDTSFRIRGQALDPDTMAIRIYIDHDVTAGVGDKGVVANQMKTIISRVYTGMNQTVSGMAIDIFFGTTSVEERIVNSPKDIATTNMGLSLLSKHLAAVARGEAEELASKAAAILNSPLEV